MKTILHWLGFLLWSTCVLGQSKEDTTEVNALIRKARAQIDLPGSYRKDFEIGIRFAEQADSLSRKSHFAKGEANALLLLSELSSSIGELQQARAYANRSLPIIRKSGDSTMIAKAFIALSGSFRDTPEELPDKIEYYEKAIRIFATEKDTLSVGKLTQFVAELYLIKGDFGTALAKSQETLKLYKSVNYERLQGLYGLLGSIYTSIDSASMALRYDLLALKTGEKLKDSGSQMRQIYNLVGISFFVINYYDQALVYFQKGLKLAEADRDTISIIWFRENSADALRKNGRYPEAITMLNGTFGQYPVRDLQQMLNGYSVFLKTYISSADYKGGEPYLEKILPIYDKPELPELLKQTSRLLIADYYAKTGRFDLVKRYLFETDLGRKLAPLVLKQSLVYEYSVYQLDSANGNFAGSLDHYKQYHRLSDSSSRIDKVKQFDQLRLQYETERKDEVIQLLTKNNELKDAAIGREKYTKNIFIGGVVLLLLLLSVSFFAFRQKQLNNRRLEASRMQIHRQNEALQVLVKEKEWLLKEVHHRVKNNLQIVMSLLNTQTAYLSSDDALRAVRDSQQRMYAMSLIHQRLYQVDRFSTIDTGWYVRELVDYMRECYVSNGGIRFDMDVDDFQLDVAQSVPLGLILNEAISNAMKYAFPNGRQGTISIRLKTLCQDTCFLSVADDGVGLPAAFDAANTDSLGMSLLLGLSAQLGGTLQIQNEHGLSLMVTFRLRREEYEGSGDERSESMPPIQGD